MIDSALKLAVPFLLGAGCTLLALSWIKDRIRP